MHRLVFFMNLFGLTINLFTLPLFLVVSVCFYKDMMKVIIQHCDGKDIMFNNFQVVSLTRGVLKLDILSNLQYFSCLFMLLGETAEDPKNFEIWLALVGIMIAYSLIVAFGGLKTVSAKSLY